MMEKLIKSETPLCVDVVSDEFVMAAEKAFDCKSNGKSSFYQWLKPDIKKGFNIGVIVGSSGSVIPLFESQIKKGETITVTHKDMTRFFMSISDAVNLIFKATFIARKKEIFILKMPSLEIDNLAKCMVDKFAIEKCNIKYVNGLLGEKLHEELITENESNYAYENSDMIVIITDELKDYYLSKGFNKMKTKLYSSKNNPLSKLNIDKLLEEYYG